MTKKDYVRIASVLKEARDEANEQDYPHNGQTMRLEIDRIARGLADVLADDNPRFDHKRFLAACGVES